jgi:hypothetical protein
MGMCSCDPASRIKRFDCSDTAESCAGHLQMSTISSHLIAKGKSRHQWLTEIYFMQADAAAVGVVSPPINGSTPSIVPGMYALTQVHPSFLLQSRELR